MRIHKISTIFIVATMLLTGCNSSSDKGANMKNDENTFSTKLETAPVA